MNVDPRCRVFFALAALGAGLNACTKFENGDKAIAEEDVICYQYPGGPDAGRIEAPQGQHQLYDIPEGTEVTIEAKPDDPFGLYSHLNTYVRIEINENPCWINTSALTKP